MIEKTFYIILRKIHKKNLAEKSFCMFGDIQWGASKHTKTLFGKMFYYLVLMFMTAKHFKTSVIHVFTQRKCKTQVLEVKNLQNVFNNNI